MLLTPFALFFLQIILGLTFLRISLRDVALTFKKWRLISLALLIQFGLVAVVGWLIAGSLPPEILLGFLIACSVPGGMSVPFLTNVLEGKVELALTITFLATVLSPLITPAMIYVLAGESLTVSPIEITKLLGYLIFIPLVIVEILKILLSEERLIRFSGKVGPPISSILFFLIVWGIISPNVEGVYQSPKLSLMIGFFSLIAMGSGYLSGYLSTKDRKDSIAVLLACGYKNNTFALVLASSFFTPMAVYPTVIYNIVNNLAVAPIQALTRKK
ncbi:bile acid:sodium symporter family protein [Candidatus Altiarchaeota archaeon]